MGATVDRLEAEKDDIAGVIIVSAKKTFFAGGDLNDLKQVNKENAGRVRRGPHARSRASCAGSRRSASRSSRASTAPRSVAAWRSRWPATTASWSTARRSSSAPPRCSSVCSPAAAASRAVRPHARHRQRADGPARAGQAAAPGQGARDGPDRRARRHAGGPDPGREEVHRGEPRGAAAVGRGQGLQDPRRHAVDPVAGAEPAGVPVEPAQAAEGRQLPGADRDHVGRGRGRAGRLRHGARDRGPLLHAAGHRSGREEHDRGVLLQPQRGQRQARPSATTSRRSRPRRSSSSAPA